MLTVGQIEALLERVTYRPGWQLTVYEDPWEGPHLRIVATMPNAYRPDETVDVGINSAIPPMPDADAFLLWLQARLIRVESHESREFLHLDGRPVFDPHAV